MITTSQLISARIHPTQAKLFESSLNLAFENFEINTTNRISAFLAQAMVESAKFTQLEENLYYTTPERLLKIFPSKIKDLAQAVKLIKNPEGLANTVYSNRLGNGDFASGDGWKFRGRGIFQLTGKENYQKASIGCKLGVDYFVIKPEYLVSVYYACLSAAWFWASHGLNELADSNDIIRITGKINPAFLELNKRKILTEENRKIFT